jgi:hypothetical protein
MSPMYDPPDSALLTSRMVLLETDEMMCREFRARTD